MPLTLFDYELHSPYNLFPVLGDSKLLSIILCYLWANLPNNMIFFVNINVEKKYYGIYYYYFIYCYYYCLLFYYCFISLLFYKVFIIILK